MKIKLLSIMAGPSGVRNPGWEGEVSEPEGKGLIEGGYAVEVKTAPVVENKKAPEPENKVLPEPEKVEPKSWKKRK